MVSHGPPVHERPLCRGKGLSVNDRYQTAPSRRAGGARSRRTLPACKETRVRNLCQQTSNVSPLFYGSGGDSAADAVPRGSALLCRAPPVRHELLFWWDVLGASG